MISVLERPYSWAVLAYCSVRGLRGWERVLKASKASKVRKRVRGVALVLIHRRARYVGPLKQKLELAAVDVRNNSREKILLQLC